MMTQYSLPWDPMKRMGYLERLREMDNWKVIDDEWVWIEPLLNLCINCVYSIWTSDTMGSCKEHLVDSTDTSESKECDCFFSKAACWRHVERLLSEDE